MTDTIDILYERATDAATNSSLSTETRREFARRLSDIEADLDALRRGDLEAWVGRFVRSEWRSREAEKRTEPLCTCGNPRCKLKRGNVPPALARSDDPPRRALTRFVDEHPGAVVLDEAVHEWDARERAAKRDLRDLVVDAREAIRARGASEVSLPGLKGRTATDGADGSSVDADSTTAETEAD